MSWETAVVAFLKFKEGVSLDKQREIVEDFEDVFECKAEFDDYGDWKFEDLNFVSHVEGRKIVELFERYKEQIKHFDFSLWYLNRPHEELLFEKGEILVSKIVD